MMGAELGVSVMILPWISPVLSIKFACCCISQSEQAFNKLNKRTIMVRIWIFLRGDFVFIFTYEVSFAEALIT
jgi:hypothetical protein